MPCCWMLVITGLVGKRYVFVAGMCHCTFVVSATAWSSENALKRFLPPAVVDPDYSRGCTIDVATYSKKVTNEKLVPEMHGGHSGHGFE